MVTKVKKELYYKVLDEGGKCFWGGQGGWLLPKGNKPGKWMPQIKGELSACSNGYHILKAEHLIDWLGPCIWTVEVRGEVQWQENKGVCRQARLVKLNPNWNEKVFRLFACDCSEMAADVELRKDKEYQKVILTIRAYAFGLASEEQLAWARAGARAGAGARAWARAGAGARAWARAGARDTSKLFEYLNGQVDIEAIRIQVEKDWNALDPKP